MRWITNVLLFVAIVVLVACRAPAGNAPDKERPDEIVLKSPNGKYKLILTASNAGAFVIMKSADGKENRLSLTETREHDGLWVEKIDTGYMRLQRDKSPYLMELKASKDGVGLWLTNTEEQREQAGLTYFEWEGPALEMYGLTKKGKTEASDLALSARGGPSLQTRNVDTGDVYITDLTTFKTTNIDSTRCTDMQCNCKNCPGASCLCGGGEVDKAAPIKPHTDKPHRTGAVPPKPGLCGGPFCTCKPCAGPACCCTAKPKATPPVPSKNPPQAH